MFNYSQWLVDFLAKAAGHKYIKRIPYMSGGRTRYRYIYKLTHMAGGKHVLDPEHMVVGAAFQMETGAGAEVHAHIVSTSGENVTYKLDDGPDKGKVFTVTRAQLAQKLDEKHGARAALATEREKQAKVVADLKARGASEKQIAREQARLERLSVSAPAPKSEDSATSRLRARATAAMQRVESAPAPKSEEPKAPELASEEPVPTPEGDATSRLRARAARSLARQATETPLPPAPAPKPSTAPISRPATTPPPVRANVDSVYSELKMPETSSPEAVAQYRAVMGYAPPTMDQLKTFALGKAAPKYEMREVLIERNDSENESLEAARFRAILGDRAQLTMQKKRVRMYPELSTGGVYVIYRDDSFRALFVDGPHKGRTIEICSAISNKNYMASLLRGMNVKDKLGSIDVENFESVKHALSDVISATGAVTVGHPRYIEATAKDVQNVKKVLGTLKSTPNVTARSASQVLPPKPVASWADTPASLRQLSERLLSRGAFQGYTGQAQGYIYAHGDLHTVYVPTTSTPTKTSYTGKDGKKQTKGVAPGVAPESIVKTPAIFSLSKDAHVQLAQLLELVPDEANQAVDVLVQHGRATFSIGGGRSILTVEGIPDRSALLRTNVDLVALRDAVGEHTEGVSFHRAVNKYDTNLQVSTPHAIHMLRQKYSD